MSEVTTEPFEVVARDGTTAVERIMSQENVSDSSDGNMHRENTVGLGDNPIAIGVYEISRRCCGLSKKSARTIALLSAGFVVLGVSIYAVVRK